MSMRVPRFEYDEFRTKFGMEHSSFGKVHSELGMVHYNFAKVHSEVGQGNAYVGKLSAGREKPEYIS